MGIYIKGMEMPRGCFECPLRHGGFNGSEAVNYCYAIYKEVSDDGEIDADCPLIPIPPHGDLIDANTKIGVELYDECREEWYEEAMTVWEYLGRASTANVQIVIPAEKEEV